MFAHATSTTSLGDTNVHYLKITCLRNNLKSASVFICYGQILGRRHLIQLSAFIINWSEWANANTSRETKNITSLQVFLSNWIFPGQCSDLKWRCRPLAWDYPNIANAVFSWGDVDKTMFRFLNGDVDAQLKFIQLKQTVFFSWGDVDK